MTRDKGPNREFARFRPWGNSRGPRGMESRETGYTTTAFSSDSDEDYSDFEYGPPKKAPNKSFKVPGGIDRDSTPLRANQVKTTFIGSDGKEISTISEVKGTSKSRSFVVRTAVEEDDDSLQVAVSFTLPHAKKPVKPVKVERHDDYPEADNESASDDSSPPDTPVTPATIHPKIESQFLPRFSKIGIGMPAFLQARFAGWYRGYYESNLLLKYGHMENPLCEIVSDKAIGSMHLSKLTKGATLTAHQRALEINIWTKETKITNVARAESWAYGRRKPTMWIELDHRVWVSRTQFESLRLGTSNTPVGYTFAAELILECARAKRDWYREVGRPDEGNYYYDRLEAIFDTRKD